LAASTEASGAEGFDARERQLRIRALWREFEQAPHPETRAALVEAHLPFAKMIAAKLYRVRMDEAVTFADYEQYARVGLLEAMDRFDASRGVVFEAYAAHRIRGAILNGLEHETEFAAQWAARRDRETERVQSMTAQIPAPERATLEELMDLTMGLALGVAIEEFQTADIVDESLQSNPYAAAELAQFAKVVRACVERLPPREREIVQNHYFKQLEFQSIAERIALTKGRVSQLHGRALALLREMIRDPVVLDRKL
jgi:RNA polymerase sigma factor for flagellar operon FliA